VLPLWVLHPLVRGSVLSITLDRAHRTSATVVNTGLLPVSFRAASGQLARHVRPTDLVHLSARPSASGYLVLHEAVSLCWWGWVIVALVVASPLAGYLWHTWRDDEAVPDPAAAPVPRRLSLSGWTRPAGAGGLALSRRDERRRARSAAASSGGRNCHDPG